MKGLLLTVMAALASVGAAKPPPEPQTKPPRGAKAKEPRPLAEASFEEILRRYTFVGDFSQKPDEREISEEIFWRYPFQLPKVDFPIIEDLTDEKRELPSSRGEGRAVDHLNRGRLLYLEKKYNEAKATWLGARARYGTSYPLHRRADYLAGLAFLKIAQTHRLENQLGPDDHQLRSHYSNAATFLSWAFIVKKDQADPLVDDVTPKGLYNLAAIYWRYDRYAGAFGAAETGLNFLRRTGRKEFRPQFHRFVAESHIKNRTYLEAVQQLDQAIRQDPDPAQAAAAFARVGDIYFDLNNYDLAEDAYALGARIDEDLKQLNAAQLVLRGESLFWLGRFSEAQKILHFALQGATYRRSVAPLSRDFAGWAALRIADAYLARKMIDKARLEYYKVGHEFRGHLAGRIAKVREACLELPHYEGQNVKHARELLEEARKGEGEIPALAQELAWACQVGSYTERERTPEMLERVREFAAAHPQSTFLRSFADPVRSYQASRIDEHFKTGDIYRALSFFEKNRAHLFPKVSAELGQKLFAAYADTYQSEKAQEFWDAHRQVADADLEALRSATVAAEMARREKSSKVWAERDQGHQRELAKRPWRLAPERIPLAYVNRLRQVPSAPGHLPWILNLARHWSAMDSAYLCDLEYPVLSSLRELGGDYAQVVNARSAELIQRVLPELFKHDESCALSLLELEAELLRDRRSELAARYLERRDWPLVGGYLHLFWTVSEHVLAAGDRAMAQKMWETIRDKAKADAPEVGFARARLDGERTEFEMLWD